MPVLRLQTNARLSPEKEKAFRAALSTKVAASLNKSEAYVMIHADFEASMLFGGSEEPCAYCELVSLGLDRERHAAFADSLTEFIATELKVASDRIYIRFEAPERSDFAWNGKPFG